MKKIGDKGSPDVNLCIHTYVNALEKKLLTRYQNDLPFFDFMDDYGYPDDDEYEYARYWDTVSKRSKKDDSIYDDFDAEYYACHRLDKKAIYFYPDVYDESKYEFFKNLHEFNEFCAKNDYFMTDRTVDEIMKRHVSHCCLDPDDLRCGDKVVIADNSYGGLFYSVCDELYD